MDQVFISYRHVEPDESLARALHKRLRERGHPVFLDTRIEVGARWLEEIDRQIRASKVMLVLLSVESIHSDMVRREVARAHHLKLRLLPIRVGFEGDLPAELAWYLGPIQCALWRPEESFEEVVEQVLAAVDGAVAQVKRYHEEPFKHLEGEVLGRTEKAKETRTSEDPDVHNHARGGREPEEMDSEPEPRPPFVVGAPIRDDVNFWGRQTQRKQLRHFLNQGQPVQILGERRMGKTSLLNWVGRHIGTWQRWPVAQINAQKPTDRSPAQLVLAIGKALEQRPRVEAILAQSSALPEARAAEQALVDMLSLVDMPLVLLVDEAEALAQPENGFDDGFLETLRALGQERRLMWISAARQDLQVLFRQRGLTSRFLNDSRQVWVGQLEAEAGRQLLAQGGLDARQIELVLAEAAGFALALQYLGEALWLGKDLSSCGDKLDEMMEIPFLGWWQDLNPKEQVLLKQGVGGLALHGLPDRDRRRARQLVTRGLLVELSGRFTLPGAAWQRFVHDA